MKARIESSEFEALKKRAALIATEGPVELIQIDTFFYVNEGRLKLREFADGTAELIAYHRPDREGPKTSDYVRSNCDGKTMLSALTRSLGVIGVVKKERTVFFVDQTRIHLDRVDGLGTFLELEVVLGEPTESSEENLPNANHAQTLVQNGDKVAHDILTRLEVDQSSLVSGAYLDLLVSKAEKNSG